MAFGFGFNKAKVLASAEKNVKQGKLSNAIQDYEKIAAHDPKDLNVLNTIGDLYVRIGNTEQAATYFRRVGDAFSSEGFTLKAIAMYKKLTKHNPTATDAILKLAEFYTQQGLYNDARAQYMAVAEQHLRKAEVKQAVAIFERVLELDPDNLSTQGRLAELYLRLGKNMEARDLYFRSAQAQRTRGMLDACDAALDHALRIDPAFAPAALLRGEVRLQAGNAAGAIAVLETLPDIDSRPDGLATLLRAHLAIGQTAEAEPLARKLLTVFNDPAGITLYGDALVAAGQYEAALRLYHEYADKLLAAGGGAMVEKLHALIGHIKGNAGLLDLLCELYRKSGDETHLPETMELLAHACVQSGALARARDLYKELAQLEPENALHAQNYKQMLARLGQDSAARPLTAAEGAQAFMVDELEPSAPLLEQSYSPDLAGAIQAALTDSELSDRYNVPGRAIPRLEAILPRAPRDITLNQRLASLYARAGRFPEAAACCRVLEAVYSEAGLSVESGQYAAMALKYDERAGLPAAGAVASPAVSPAPHPIAEPEPAHRQTSFLSGSPDLAAESARAQSDPAPADGLATGGLPLPFLNPGDALTAGEASVPEFDIEGVSGVPAAEVEKAAAPGPAEVPGISPATTAAGPGEAFDAPVAHEIDLSDEWERVVAAEPQQLESAVPVPKSADVLQPEPAHGPESAPVPDAAALSDLVEEITFYISQSMWEEARSALAKAESMAPASPLLSELRAQVPAGQVAATEGADFELISDLPSQDGNEEAEAADLISLDLIPEPVRQPSPAEPAAPVAEADDAALTEAEPDTVFARSGPEALSSGGIESIPEIAALASGPEIVLELSPPAPADGAQSSFQHGGAANPPVSPVPSRTVAESVIDEKPPMAAPAADDLIGGIVLDLEESLGEDFDVHASPSAIGGATNGGAAAPGAVVAPPAANVTAQALHAATPAAAAGMPVLTPLETATPQSPSASANAGDAAGLPSALSDIFAEFKEDMERGISEPSEDPETHYNLGVAFKEMGLLDEAIGELQKVCQAIDRGAVFPRVMEAYTWLADCFLQKGVPEAAVRWYEKTLQVPGISDEGATAIHYELGCAHEAAQNQPQALRHFLQVYGSNIDYRDVAERIKTLKS